MVLRMCMPTFWCVKAFPEDVIESFERIYRKDLKKKIPAASDDAVYYENYVAACAYWMWSLARYIPHIRSLHPNLRHVKANRAQVGLRAAEEA